VRTLPYLPNMRLLDLYGYSVLFEVAFGRVNLHALAYTYNAYNTYNGYLVTIHAMTHLLINNTSVFCMVPGLELVHPFCRFVTYFF
jgi:hypothetical protein